MRRLTKWIKFLLFFSMFTYLLALLLPYYLVYTRNILETPIGLKFVVPLFSLLLLIPIYILMFKKKGPLWLPFIFSFLLLIPVNFIQFVLIQEFGKMIADIDFVYPIFGYWSHILTGIIIMIACILYIRANSPKDETSELLDIN